MSWLHEQRLAAVTAALRSIGAETVLDLGCGDGALLIRLAEDPAVKRIVGLDVSAQALQELDAKLSTAAPNVRQKVELVHGSMTEPSLALSGFDAAVLVETIEHIDPERLSLLERAVFRDMIPGAVIITTPNSDFNGMLGVPVHRFRHRDHRFEWGRAKFRTWSSGVAQRNGYEVMFDVEMPVAEFTYGGATQMALFTKQAAAPRQIAQPQRTHP
jgi:small RNA 2'-O-methyltransferase